MGPRSATPGAGWARLPTPARPGARQGAGAALASHAVAWGVGREVDDVSAFQEAVQRGGDQRGGPEHGGPVVDAEVAGQNCGAVAVTLMNELVEHAGEAALYHNGVGGMVADLVQDQQIRPAVLLQDLLERLVCDGSQEVFEHVVGADVADAVAGRAGPGAEADREVALADAGGAEKEDRLAAVEEAELGQIEDGLAIDGRLRLEV